MRTRQHGLLSNAVSLAVCGLLAGLVVAAAAFPAVAMSGLAAKAGADGFENLPADLDLLPAPQNSYVYASDGKTLLATIYDENRRDVPIGQMALVMQQAMVASEDVRFYDHRGVDIKGVARAFVANQQNNGVAQGASTLTMQYVRLAISYSARTPQQVVNATADTPNRKLQEMRYALALEKKYNKQQILERYLNIAPFGEGAYGIYAASQVFFGKPPADLTLAEASLLAGLVQAPSRYNPADPKKLPAALERREYVLRQMVTMKYITEAQLDAAKLVKLSILGKRAPEGCASTRPELAAGFFCDYLNRWWLEQPAFGADEYERENRLRSGGYTIISSLDVTTQTAAHLHIEENVNTGRTQALMLASVQPGTGRVLALATNRNFSNDQSGNGPNTNPAKRGQIGNYPNTTLPLVTGGGDVNGYQTGSTNKIFTAVAALEKGYTLDYTINVVSPYISKYIVEPGPAACGNKYCPRNANPAFMNGPRTMWDAFGRSANTYFVPLEERAGADKAVEVAKRLGIHFRAESDAAIADNPAAAAQWGAFTLGVASMTPLELANAYATLAADGLYCEPIPVVEIRDLSGAKVDAGDPRCKQVVTADVARAAVDMARCPLHDQSAYGKCSGYTDEQPPTRDVVGRPVAGKTGTTDGNRTATLVAMTKQVAIAGTMADPDNPQTNEQMSSLKADNAVKYTLRDAMANLPAINFTAPSRGIAFGKRARIPDVKCQPVDVAIAAIRGAGFDVTQAQDPVDSACPAGTVAGTNPTGDTVIGSSVVIQISKGTTGHSAGGPPPACLPPRLCLPTGR